MTKKEKKPNRVQANRPTGKQAKRKTGNQANSQTDKQKYTKHSIDIKIIGQIF